MFLHIPSARNLLPEHCHQDESAGTAQTHLENQVPETSGSGLPSTSVNISVYTCKTLSHQTKKKTIILLVHFSPKHHKSDFWPLNLIHLHLRCHRGYSWDWKTLYKFNSIKVIWKHQPWLATEKKICCSYQSPLHIFPSRHFVCLTCGELLWVRMLQMLLWFKIENWKRWSLSCNF